MGISFGHLIIVLLVVVLLFGTKRVSSGLPELGTSLGQFIANFKKSFKDNSAIDVTPKSEGGTEKIEDKKQG